MCTFLTSGTIVSRCSTSDGIFLTKFSSLGSGNGQVNHPAGIALDQNDNIYIADSGNARIQAFTGSVELPNQPPAAISQTVSTNEDTPKSMHLNATDADLDTLTYSIESPPDLRNTYGIQPFNW